MPLDKDILNIVEITIQSDLAAPKVPRKRVPKLKRVWKCNHAHDFLYGNRAGYYKGLAEGFVLERYKHHLTEDEESEVFDVIDKYAKDLRKYFAYYKERKTSPSHKQ